MASGKRKHIRCPECGGFGSATNPGGFCNRPGCLEENTPINTNPQMMRDHFKENFGTVQGDEFHSSGGFPIMNNGFPIMKERI